MSECSCQNVCIAECSYISDMILLNVQSHLNISVDPMANRSRVLE